MIDFGAMLWDRRFMEMAKMVASWSKDPSTKVGAVIVHNRKVVATGYNGFPPGIDDDTRLEDRSRKYPRIIHAEMNAILQAGHDARGATMYMFFPAGGAPCANCTKHIIGAGITRLVVRTQRERTQWADDQAISVDMIEEAGIIYRKMQ